MIENTLKSARKSIKHWWASLIVGLLAVALGIWCMVTPDKSLVALTYIFIAAFLIGGIIDIGFAIANRKMLSGWGWDLTSGILEVILGIVLVILPRTVVSGVLIYVVGFWILFRSIWAIGESIQLQTLGIKGWGWLLVIGIIALLFSFIYLLSPAFGGISLIIFASLGLLSYGIFRIYLAFKLQGVNSELKKIEKLME